MRERQTFLATYRRCYRRRTFLGRLPVLHLVCVFFVGLVLSDRDLAGPKRQLHLKLADLELLAQEDGLQPLRAESLQPCSKALSQGLRSF